MVMRFDGSALAHAWLAVAQASSSDSKLPVLFRTVCIEEYETGVRLIATDRFMLLTTWVADLGNVAEEPGIPDAPLRTVVAQDPDGRARSLFGYVLSLVGRIDPEEYVPGQVEVSIDFDVRLPVGSSDETLDGLEPTYTVLSVPDVEQVFLPVVEVPFPDAWRQIVSSHEGEETKEIGLNPEFLERLGKVRKHAAGTLTWTFGGSDRAALVEWAESDPHVSGIVMPRLRVEPDETEDTDREAECPTCADGGLCLRHTSGVITIGDLS